MVRTPYFSSVVSESAFKARFQAENGQNFSELEEFAASGWGRPHLLACRVVRRDPQRNILPILSKYAIPSDVQSPSDEIQAFLRGPDSTFMTQSEHYLVRRSNCGISLAQIWAAMAMFKGNQGRSARDISTTILGQNESERDNDDGARPKRLRRQTSQPYFTDSGGIRVGSSSPLPDGSQDGSDRSYVDSSTHYLSITPEDDTVRLASCVIRHILYFAAPQNSASNPVVVEFRDAKTRLAATTALGGQPMIAIDDGGLCLRRQTQDGYFMLAKNHVAVLEAKSQFHCVENGRPIISDKSFAQMVCEALATRLSNRNDKSLRSVIVINATQHYMCFLQIDINDDYVMDFETTSPTHMLYVSATPWFDLSQKNGRENVLANLCGIMRRAISE